MLRVHFLYCGINLLIFHSENPRLGKNVNLCQDFISNLYFCQDFISNLYFCQDGTDRRVCKVFGRTLSFKNGQKKQD